MGRGDRFLQFLEVPYTYLKESIARHPRNCVLANAANNGFNFKR